MKRVPSSFFSAEALARGVTAAALVAFSVGCGGGEEPPAPDTPHIRVWEYTPAPGQFINESPAYDGVVTPEAACTFAGNRLNKGFYVSLGGWGGYIVAGFETSGGGAVSIANSDGYDFSVTGNQMSTSSEPGVVWVMADDNGNGAPDDTWYELRGSETGAEGTAQGYEITYLRPAEGEDVQWTDNQGGSGVVRRMDSFGHTQPDYYPAWIAAGSYSLRGTLLASRTVQDGIWENRSYEWGYADNWGSDGGGGNPRKTLFDISNAIDAGGRSVTLAAIHFIKIQTAVNADAGPLGEVSTEVCGLAVGSE